MGNLKLTAELRTETGKGPARRLREAGRVPGTIYGAGQANQAISVDERRLYQIVQHAGLHNLIELHVNGAEKGAEVQRVLIKELARDPVRDEIVHVDFHAVALDQEMQTVVAVVVEGEERRTDDGIVTVVLRELDITCLPTDIPESLSIDVSELSIGDVVTVADVAAPAGVQIITDPEEVVVTVTPPQVADAAEETDAEAAEEAEDAASAGDAPSGGDEE